MQPWTPCCHFFRNNWRSVAEPAENYPMSLALFDYVPVFLTFLGYGGWVLWQADLFAGLQAYALGAVLLMFAGGFLKASWKTIIAGSRRDIRWMEHALFLLLTPGACLFAWALWLARGQIGDQQVAVETSSVIVPVIISAIFIAVSLPRINKSEKWFLPLVLLLTLAMAWIALVAAWMAWQQGAVIAASLFVANFLASSITAKMSRRAASIAAQWRMEWANTASAALFLLAVVFYGAGL